MSGPARVTGDEGNGNHNGFSINCQQTTFLRKYGEWVVLVICNYVVLNLWTSWIWVIQKIYPRLTMFLGRLLWRKALEETKQCFHTWCCEGDGVRGALGTLRDLYDSAAWSLFGSCEEEHRTVRRNGHSASAGRIISKASNSKWSSFKESTKISFTPIPSKPMKYRDSIAG